MPSIFKSRSNKSKPTSTSLNPSLSSSTTTSSSASSSQLISPSKSLPSLHHQSPTNHSIYKPTHIDDFGRPILNPTPAFTLASSTLSTSSSAHQLSQPSSSDQAAQELQLLYGYTGLFTQIELDILTTSQLIKLISNQLKSRPLDSPLLFSSHALDLSSDSTHSLIRSFINRHHSHFLRDIQISSPHNLSAFLKWVLARYINPQSQHGLLNWSSYLLWRQSENDSNYPPDSITTQLFKTLTANSAEILITLLDLFSSVAAYSHLNGITIHKCGAIFGAFIFGLEDDLPFEQTYTNWLRYAHATEHMILAYLRDQKAKSTTGEIASRLESCIRSYPKVIPSLTSTHPSARLESVARFRRNVRFYNKNLIQNASKWEVKGSKTWQRLLSDHHSSPNMMDSASSNSNNKPHKPIFTKSYKHLLNISAEQELEGSDDPERNEIDLETQRFKSLVEKQWSGFISKGFEGGVTETEKKLEFDLDESEKQQRRQRRETMDWDSFAGSGFAGRETYTAKELLFNTQVSNKVTNWPTEEKDLSKKLSKTNKILPPFPYDIEPIEISPILVDDNFFEAWVDALIASGWTRDELKEVSWVLVHYKSQSNNPSPRSMTSNCLSNDTRNDEMWVLFEEIVPEEYRMTLMKNAGDKSNVKRSRRISFLKAVITRSHKDPSKKPGPSLSSSLGPRAPSSHQHSSPPLGVISEYGGNQMTKKITLTPDLPSSSSFSESGSMVSYPSSLHPSERTLDSNRPTGSGTGFMAELRARAKKRQQSYNIGAHLPNPMPLPPQQYPRDDWIDVQTDEDSNPIPSRPHHPTPPSILDSSRSVTPIQGIGSAGGENRDHQKRRLVPGRKESLVNSLHSSSGSRSSLTQLSHRGSSSVTSIDLSVQSGEDQEAEKASYGTMTPKKERKVKDHEEEESKNPPLLLKSGANGKSDLTNSKITFPNSNASEVVSGKALKNDHQGDSSSHSDLNYLNPTTHSSPRNNQANQGSMSSSIQKTLNSSSPSRPQPNQGSSSILPQTTLSPPQKIKNLGEGRSTPPTSEPMKKSLNSTEGSPLSHPQSSPLSPPRTLNPSSTGRDSPILNNRYLTPKKPTEDCPTRNVGPGSSSSSNSLGANRYEPGIRNEESRKKIEELKFTLKSNYNQSNSNSKDPSEESSSGVNGGRINRNKEITTPIQVFEKSKVQKVSKIVDMFEKSEPLVLNGNKSLTNKEPKVMRNVEKFMKNEEDGLKKVGGVSSDQGREIGGLRDDEIPVRQFKLSRVGEE